MNSEYIYKTSVVLAQAYGVDGYSAQAYSGCEETTDGCIAVTETAPNTGFFGLSQDAAIASVSGALLIAIAVVGTVMVVLSRRRAHKKGPKE